MLANKKKLVGNIKTTSRHFPNYRAIISDFNDLTNVVIGQELDIFEQNMYYDNITLSTNY